MDCVAVPAGHRSLSRDCVNAHRNEAESLHLCKGTWRYLRSTWDKVIQYKYKSSGDEPVGGDEKGDSSLLFRIVSDASLAPGGARSRSGVALSGRPSFVLEVTETTCSMVSDRV